MNIDFSEQRELANLIARRLRGMGVFGEKTEKALADVIWEAIEDYTYEPPTADILEMSKASTEGL